MVFRALPLFLLGFSVLGCGQIKWGAPATPNDAEPSGTVVAQGSFEGVNDKTVTGTVQVYRLNESGTHLIRLNGITSPSESGLQVVAKQNGEVVYRTSLRNVKGTQNYSTDVVQSQNWESVSIFSTATDKDYGMALLTGTGTGL